MEIVLVIVLIAIFATVLKFANKDDDRLHLATLQVLEHIRYTQHLAMSDNKFDPKENRYKYTPDSDGVASFGKYYKGWWQIRFVKQFNGEPKIVGYSVYSDFDREGNIDLATTVNPAINPADGFRMTTYLRQPLKSPEDVENSVSKKMNIYTEYGIIDIKLSGGCSRAGFTRVTSGNIGSIAFDEKGRPYYGISNDSKNNPFKFKLNSECDLSFTADTNKTATIRIYPESGYAEILNIEQ